MDSQTSSDPKTDPKSDPKADPPPSETTPGDADAGETTPGTPDGEAIGRTRDAAIARVEEELAGLRAALAACRAALDQAERRHEIELALLRADALDMETARVMTEALVASMAEPDVARAVEDLRRRKPFLFRAKRAPGASAGLGAPGGGVTTETNAAARGDRAALLRFLRARRV
jgi:hypothetical protein